MIKNPVKWVVLIILSMLQLIPIFAFVIFLIVARVDATSLYTNMPLLIGGFVGMIICMLLFNAFYQGYLINVLRGEQTLPEISNPTLLFSDGIKFMIIQLIYFILPTIVLLASILIAVTAAYGGNPVTDSTKMMTVMGSLLIGLVIFGILAIIFSLFWVIGIVRFARTGDIWQAFRIHEILATIRSIGWLQYFLALVILFITLFAYAIAMYLIQTVLMIIPLIGVIFYLFVSLIQIILAPVIAVYTFRYISLLYDSAGSA
jgi:hypothetical protein